MCGLHRFVWDAQFFPQRHASSRQWAPFRTGLGCCATPIGIGIFSGPRRTPPCPGQKIRFSILAGLIESLLSRQGHLGPGLRGPGGEGPGRIGQGRGEPGRAGPGRVGLGRARPGRGSWCQILCGDFARGRRQHSLVAWEERGGVAKTSLFLIPPRCARRGGCFNYVNVAWP